MAGSQEFEVRSTAQDGVSLVAVSGEIDVPEAAELGRALQHAQGPVVVDLRDCRFMGSEGLRALLVARDQSIWRERRFVVLIASQGPVARLLDLVGGRHIFNVCEDDREAAVRMAAVTDRRQGPDRRTHQRPG